MMRLRRRRPPVRSLVVGLLALAWACGGEVPLEPPELRPGVDVCHACGMMITDLRFAAARIVRDDAGGRRVQRFDDIGCMARHWAEHPDEEVEAAYVRPARGEGWLPAGEAWYVRSPSFVTPMLYGLAALRSAAEVRGVLDEPPMWEGDLDALLARAAEGALQPIPASPEDAP